MSLLTSAENIKMLCQSVIVLNNTFSVQKKEFITVMVSCHVKCSPIWFHHCKCCRMRPQPVYISFIWHFSGFCLHSLLVETGLWHLFFSIHPWGGKSKENIYAPLSLWHLAECVPPYHQIITILFILDTSVVILLFCLELYLAWACHLLCSLTCLPKTD